ncbi:MAG: hypothetical protein ACOCVF_00150 [bacterium]
MMNNKELDELIEFEKKNEKELELSKQIVIDDLINTDISETNSIFKKRKKIEGALRKKYIKYIKRKNKSYKYDDFEDVDFFDIRDLYFKEKRSQQNRFQRKIIGFFDIFKRIFS